MQLLQNIHARKPRAQYSTLLWACITARLQVYSVVFLFLYRTCACCETWPFCPVCQSPLLSCPAVLFVNVMSSPRHHFQRPETRPSHALLQHYGLKGSSCLEQALCSNALYIFTTRRVCIARTMPWQNVCLSVCLSHAGIRSKRLYISSNSFTIG